MVKKIIDKKCKRCNLIKPINKFHRDKSFKDGYRSKCIECRHKPTINEEIAESKINEIRNAYLSIGSYKKVGLKFNLSENIIRKYCKDLVNKKIKKEKSDEEIKLQEERTKKLKKNGGKKSTSYNPLR